MKILKEWTQVPSLICTLLCKSEVLEVSLNQYQNALLSDLGCWGCVWEVNCLLKFPTFAMCRYTQGGMGIQAPSCSSADTVILCVWELMWSHICFVGNYMLVIMNISARAAFWKSYFISYMRLMVIYWLHWNSSVVDLFTTNSSSAD